MFGTVLTLAYTAMLAYVLWRGFSVPVLARRLSRRRVFIVGAALWTLFFVGRFVGHDGTGPVAEILELVGMAALGAVFLTSMSLLIVDLVTVFGRVASTWAPRLRGWALVTGGILSGFALVQGHRAPAVVSYEVTLPDLPKKLDGTVIVALSDTHVGSRIGEAWLTKRLEQAQALRPDIVVFLGDMFEGHGEAPRDIPALHRLAAPLGKWFVHGNHESHRRQGTHDALLERAGFRRLANQSVEVAPGLVLAGVDDLTTHRSRGLPGGPIAEALASRLPGATVLLSHTPWEAERAASHGVELMLSGHTHGGQIWPFGCLVRTVYPLLAGRYDVDGTTVIVGRGTGTWGPRMRLWHRGEIVEVILRSE